jgi:hypothetical protein
MKVPDLKCLDQTVHARSRSNGQIRTCEGGVRWCDPDRWWPDQRPGTHPLPRRCTTTTHSTPPAAASPEWGDPVQQHPKRIPKRSNAMLGTRRIEMGRTHRESRSTDLCPRRTADHHRRREIPDDWTGHRAQYVTPATNACQRTISTPPWPSIVGADIGLRRQATVSHAARFSQWGRGMAGPRRVWSLRIHGREGAEGFYPRLSPDGAAITANATDSRGQGLQHAWSLLRSARCGALCGGGRDPQAVRVCGKSGWPSRSTRGAGWARPGVSSVIAGLLRQSTRQRRHGEEGLQERPRGPTCKSMRKLGR